MIPNTSQTLQTKKSELNLLHTLKKPFMSNNRFIFIDEKGDYIQYIMLSPSYPITKTEPPLLL